MRNLAKTLFLLIAITLLIAFSTNAWANEVTFSTLPTQGCFGSGCTPVSSPSINGLTFVGAGTGEGSYNSVGGILDLTLGSFTLVNTAPLFDPNLYLGSFTAMVKFENPVFIAGGQNPTFTACYVGMVTKLLGGGLLINFGDTQHFTFSNGTYIGSFDLKLDDVFLAVGGKFTGGSFTDTENLIGHITNASQTAVPEPASVLLLGSAVMVFLGYRRR